MKDEAATAEQAAEVQKVKDECSADLAEAIPILNDALKALDTIKKQDLDLVKAMGKPPAGGTHPTDRLCAAAAGVHLRRHNAVHPFEDATPMEFLSQKNDASLFAFGTHSKKRPHNLVFGRLFDHHILDMVETGVAGAWP